MLAQRNLSSQNVGLTKSLQRLSTGLRINRGADDPAGLIASENLRSETAAINSAITNAERAEQVMNVAEGGLQEVSNLLVELQSLVSATANEAGVSSEEKEANQLQIDSILQTIDRIANATEFQGEKLLNGNFDYQTNASTAATELSDVKINSAKLPADGTAMNISVEVVTAAEAGQIVIQGDAAGDFVNGGAGNSYTLEITGDEGTQQFTFADGTALTDVEAAIDAFGAQLGVEATVSAIDGGNQGVVVSSTTFGSESFVRVLELNDGGTGNNLVGEWNGAAFSASDDYSEAVSDSKYRSAYVI